MTLLLLQNHYAEIQFPCCCSSPKAQRQMHIPTHNPQHWHLKVLPRRLGFSQTLVPREVNQCDQNKSTVNTPCPLLASPGWVWKLSFAHSNQILQLKCSFYQRVKPAHLDSHICLLNICALSSLAT